MRAALCLALLVLALPLHAQEGEVPPQPAAEAAEPAAAAPQAIEETAMLRAADYADWLRTAARIETISETGRGSGFALERLRADVVIWRDRFLAAQEVNAARIATVELQIAALGAAPADDATAENTAIANRRSALRAQLARLQAPVALAREAHAHSNGLIGEIDSLIRARQTQVLMTRGVSPLDPRQWPGVADVLSARMQGIWKEVSTTVRSPARIARLVAVWPGVAFSLLVALVLLARGPAWVNRARSHVAARNLRGRGLWDFLISLASIALPYGGIVALSSGLSGSELFGFRAQSLIATLPEAGGYVILAHWLAGHLMQPDGAGLPSFDMAAQPRARARRTAVWLGWVLGAGVLLRAFLATGETPSAIAAVVFLPVQIAISVLLYRLGRSMIGPKAVAGSEGTQVGRGAATLVGRAAILVAVAGPVLSMAGYGTAAEALIYPFVMTLALIGLVILLQRLVFDIYTLLVRSEEAARDALTPLLIGFVLAMLAVPVLALIWGARIEDLWEVWTRFREGYAIGDSRISPTDFVMFIVIFVIGYMLTRLVQRTLRGTVLPKTRIDIGGQNAIVSGVGYVGIFVAAITAITSAGIDLSNLAIVAGALSVGIGFGLQNIVSNFVSGIILLIERPISEGDWIEVGGKMGYVRDISVRSTRIETFDRTDVIVPNADLVSGQVINWTRGNSVGRVIVPVGVAYGTDSEKVTAILREIAEANPMVLLTPPPTIVFQGFGADSLDFEIRAIVRDVNFGLTVRTEMNHAIVKRFAAEGIEIPFPQRDVWLRNPETLRPPAAHPAPTAQPETDKPA
ncbi:MAG: mechanosensitive ion channel family protein [Rhodobacterales bacterium]|nr:mechanosensitive ion channel family protein [Rhodobacterales bacterium]